MLAVPTSSNATEVVDIESRGEITRILVEDPEPYLDFNKDPPEVKPETIGVAVLFAGGGGVLKITEYGNVRKLSGNFLIRSANYFRENGFVTAIIDGPSDQAHSLYGFRGSSDHAEDIGAVIGHLRAKYTVPIWLVGTSRGTNSVANAAIRLNGENGPDGIVLTSSMLASNRKGDYVLQYDLDEIRVPVVIAHHRNDSCSVTPPHNVDDMAEDLEKARHVKVLWYEGGVDVGPACQARGHHGFAGIEKQVVDDISEAMRATR